MKYPPKSNSLLLQNMVALVTGTLSSSKVFVNQIYYFVVSVSAMYSASHLEVTTDFYFLEY
jgi:hypothetical protein